MRLGIFGGSFDPPHLGHKHLAEKFVKICELDSCLIIPAYVSPHKHRTDASGVDRLNMCQLLFNEPHYEVTDIELKRTGKSYTIDTLESLVKSHPDDKIILSMGTDMLTCFTSWHRYKDILDLCDIFAFARENGGELKMHEYVEKNLPEYYDKIHIFAVNPLEMSSTEIRDLIEENADTTGYLSEEVRKYIDDRGLYS